MTGLLQAIALSVEVSASCSIRFSSTASVTEQEVALVVLFEKLDQGAYRSRSPGAHRSVFEVRNSTMIRRPRRHEGYAGATLVLVSTALLAATATLLAFVHLKRWLFGLLLTLSVIDAAATAVAAYFLMANVLVATMLLALLAGLAAAFAGSRQGRMTT